MAAGHDIATPVTGAAGASPADRTRGERREAGGTGRTTLMRLEENVDFSTLGWVKPQIDELLAEARQVLEAFSEDAADTAAMQRCMELLHQASATLRMVELYGAAELGREMEELARALLAGQATEREEALGALMRGLVQVPDYLDLIESGHKDIPIVLLPLLNELRGARGAEAVDRRTLFHPDLARPLPPDAAGARAAYPFADVRQCVIRVRAIFQVQLLAWNQGRQPDFATMRDCIDEVRAVCHAEAARRLWWVAGGVLDALQQDRLDRHLASLRQQFGHLDRALRRVQDQGEEVCTEADAHELTKALLYFIAEATPGTGRTDAIARCFALVEMVPTERELEHARAAMSGRNRVLLDTVAKAIREDLLRAKEELDIFLRRDGHDLQQLLPPIEILRRVSDTLDVLGLQAPAKMVDGQKQALVEMVDGQREAKPDAVLDIASALLYVDASLDDQIEHLGAASSPPEGALPPGEARRIMRVLMHEAGANLGKVKECITAFVESSWAHDQLADIPKLLTEVGGALRMLDLERPADLVAGIDRYVRSELITRRRVPTVDEMNCLADAVAGVEYYLEVGHDTNASDSRVLDVAQCSLELLHYWPAPGQGASGAVDPQGTVDATEPPVAAPEQEVAPGDSDAPVAAIAAAPAESPTPTAVVPGVGEGEWVEVEEEVLEPVGGDPAVADTSFQDAAGIDEEIREVFIEEVGEEIANLGASLPAWEAAPEDLDVLGDVRRSFHTLKGSGRLVGAVALGEFSWKVENLLNRVLDQTIRPDANVQALVDAAVATLPKLHARLRGENVVLDPPLDAIMQAADKLAAGEPVRVEDLTKGYRKVVRKVRQWVPAPEPALVVAPPVDAPFEPVVLSPVSGLPVVDPVLLDVLRTEVGQHLAGIRDYLARDHACDAAVDAELLRSVHTLHGAIGMVGIEVLAGVFAPLEDWIGRMCGAGAALDREGCDALRDVVAMTEHVMAQFDAPVADVPDTAALVERLVSLGDAWPEAAPLGVDGHGAAVPAVEDELAGAAAVTGVVAQAEPGAASPMEGGALAATPGSATLEPTVEDTSAAQQAAAEAAEQARIAAEHEREAAARAEERLAAERAEQERAAAEAAERARIAAEHEREAAERAEQERAAAEAAERARIAAEHEREAAARAEQERLAAEQAEQARLAVAREKAAAELAATALPTFPEDPQPDGALELPDLDLELVELFTEEAGELLDSSDGLLAALRAAPDDVAPMHGLQRDLHTLKGGARVVGISQVGDLAHAMETLLERVAGRAQAMTPLEVDSFERGFDRLHGLIERVRQGLAIATPVQAIERFTALAEGRPVDAADLTEDEPGTPTEATAEDRPDVQLLPPPPPREAPRFVEAAVTAPVEMIRVRSDLLDTLVNAAGEASIFHARLEQQVGDLRFNLAELGQTVSRLREQLRKLEIETETQILSRYEREHEAGASAAFDPLELDRYSNMQQYSRALAESASDLASIQDVLSDRTRQSEALLLQQSRANSDLQDGLMRARMVPFESLVPTLRRTLRGAADELGKQAQLKVAGAQGEMDRSVLARMKAPFEHMLRNALTHGIEAPVERVARGKPAAGTVTIEVSREGAEVLVRVTDDGAGFDREAIRAKAIQRGLMKPDAVMADRALYDFVLQTGFSTASEISQLAGRGVGMDVVANEIRQLGGSLVIESERGQGTTFSIRLPFTLAVTPAITVRAGATTFAMPMTSLQGISRIPRAELARRLATGDRAVAYVDEAYTLHDLPELLGIAPASLPEEGAGQLPLLMVRAGDLHAAVCIDAVLGAGEVVLKSVGPQISNVPGIFGATIRGDGSVMLILDLAPLVRRFAAERAGATEDAVPPLAGAPADAPPAGADKPPLVMVVDDSITMRKATTRVLERERFAVVTARDGVEALEKMQERIPDVMLLDVEMPRMDGYELASRMRNDTRLRGVPIIMITSRTGEKHRQRAFELGVQRYLGKPYSEADLLHNVGELLGTYHAR